MAAHLRRVTRKRELIAAIRRNARYLPNFTYIARILRDQEHLFPRNHRAVGDIGLALANTWARRGYYESERALTEWRFRT